MDATTGYNENKDKETAQELLNSLVEQYNTEVLSWLAWLLIRGDRPPYPSVWGKRATKLLHDRDRIMAEHTKGI